MSEPPPPRRPVDGHRFVPPSSAGRTRRTTPWQKFRSWPPGAQLLVAALLLLLVAVLAAPGSHRSANPAARPTPTGRVGTTLSAVGPTTVAAPAPGSLPPAPTAAPPVTEGDAAAQLAALPTGSTSGSPTYRRSEFGAAWADVDHNGCDTRDDILHRDLTGIRTRPGTHDCVVVSGLLHDPYTGTDIEFEKARASEVQIDHVLPLADAWYLGAWRWSAGERLAYANDPIELLAVSGAQNQAKGDKLADRWKPPNGAEWCDYARRTVAIHTRYALPVTQGERGALTQMLTSCR